MNRLQSKPFVGLLLDPFGQHAREIELRHECLLVRSRRGGRLHLGGLVTAPSVEKKLLGSTLKLSAENSHSVILKGASHAEAAAFAKVVKAAWIAYNTRLFEAEQSSISFILSALGELADPTRYPSACRLSPILKEAQRLHGNLLSRLPQDAVAAEVYSKIQAVLGFALNAKAMRENAIARYEERQLADWATFFDTFESILAQKSRLGAFPS